MEQLIPTINFGAFFPELVIAAVAIFVLMLQVFASQYQKYIGYVALMGVAVAMLITLFQPSAFQEQSVVQTFSGLWVVDNYSRFFNLIFLLGTGLTILISVKYVGQEKLPQGEYYALLLMATLGMMVMAGSEDLMPIFLGLELMSISLYVLAGYARARQLSNESALKYFLLGSFATGFLLYGMALLYGATGTTNIHDIAEFITRYGFNPIIVTIGMVLLVVGFGFKMAAVPFHMWTPDVYQGAPTPVTAFMSAGPKAAAFAALVRVFVVALPMLQVRWTILIWILAVLTMTVGNVLALVQDNIKRMLAYSSIAHAGYILIGFVSGTAQGMSAILFYLLAYTLMNIGAFAIITYLGGQGDEKVTINDYAGMGYRHPIAAVVLSLFLFSLAGIPPTAGFMGKFYIFSGAIQAGYLGLAIIGVLNSVVSVYYYLKVTIAMYMKTPDIAVSGSAVIPASPMLAAAVVISVYGVVSMGIFPSLLITLAQQSHLFLK